MAWDRLTADAEQQAAEGRQRVEVWVRFGYPHAGLLDVDADVGDGVFAAACAAPPGSVVGDAHARERDECAVERVRVRELLAGVDRKLRRDGWLFRELGRYVGDEEEDALEGKFVGEEHSGAEGTLRRRTLGRGVAL